jgi:hypothetical protein
MKSIVCYVAGTGFVMTFAPTASNEKAGFISIYEGKFVQTDF